MLLPTSSPGMCQICCIGLADGLSSRECDPAVLCGVAPGTNVREVLCGAQRQSFAVCRLVAAAEEQQQCATMQAAAAQREEGEGDRCHKICI